MKFEGVIFDWAGTIVDFGSLAPMGAFVQLFEHHGVRITIDQARIPMGLPKLEHIRALGTMSDIAQLWRDAHSGRAFNDDDANMLLAEFEPMSAAAAWQHRAFVPGFMQTYSRLIDRGIRVATTTGYTRKIMQPIIDHAKSMGFLPDAVICCDDVQHSRPDPMGIYACCQAMGLQPGRHIIKVDDTAPGIAEGRNANCYTIGVAVSGNALGWSLAQWESASQREREAAFDHAGNKLRKSGADLVISSVAELEEAIELLEQSR